jgi:hypothetical protein
MVLEEMTKMKKMTALATHSSILPKFVKRWASGRPRSRRSPISKMSRTTFSN